MFEFLKLQYRLGHITERQLLSFVPRWLTAEEAEEILNKEEK